EHLLTERLVLTLKGPADGVQWNIASEEVQDTRRFLTRGVPGDEQFRRFGSVSFDREGLKVAGGAGTLYLDHRLGRVERIVFAAEGLAFEYSHPIPRDRQLFELRASMEPRSYPFEPELASVSCDPESCDELLASMFTGLATITREQLTGPMVERYDSWLKDTLKARKEDGFAGFRIPFEPENRYISLTMWRDKPERQLYFEYDDEEPLEVTFGATEVGAWRYPSEATRRSGTSADALDRRPDIWARDYEVESVKGTVELGFGDGELLTGDLTFRLNARRELIRLPFRVARLSESRGGSKEARNPRMTINSVQDGKGRELTVLKTGPVSAILMLPEPVPAGGAIQLRVQFENKDSIYKLTPTYSYVDRAGWLPFVRFGDMIHELELTIKVPRRYTVLAVGRKVQESRDEEALLTQWEAERPVVFPTVIFGIYKQTKAGVKATRMDGQEIALMLHFDRDSLGAIAPKALGVAADEAANALNLFREVFGVDYPYSKLDVVNAPQGLAGQSPSSIVYLGTTSFLSKGVLGTLGGAAVTRFTDSLVDHEVAHQWWGSLVAPANDRSYWWVESLAEYAAALYIEQVHGRKAYLEMVEDWRRAVLEAESWHSVQDGSGIYTKGPLAFHIMRSTWGDEVFFKFLRNLTSELQGREIVTSDIQSVAEKTFGAKLDWFFDQWIRDVGLPQFTFSYKMVEGQGGEQVLEADIRQQVMKGTKAPAKQVLDGVLFKGITAVTIIGRSGKEYKRRVVFEGPTVSFKSPLPEKPKEIVLNKYHEMLAYDVLVEERP
ncbi:MAG TPA: M1 family aminopeptidase, partial [Candidatus Polarisedimenticolia bacterium]|nr:M1 family aminopeptidase [Candidatus Polarisedimenticolia bacterium]